MIVALAHRPQKVWTQAEIDRLAKLVSQGLTSKAISKIVGRTVSAINKQLSLNKITRTLVKDPMDYTVRMPGDLYDQFYFEAKRLGMSKGTYMRRALEHELERTRHDT